MHAEVAQSRQFSLLNLIKLILFNKHNLDLIYNF